MTTISETVAIVCAIFTGLGLLILVVEKLWGGGNALAGKFHKLDKETTAAIAALELRVTARVDQYEDNAAVGFEAIRANIHAMQTGLLEFRAKMAEDLHLYIRKDDYNAGLTEVRRAMSDGFKGVDERLSQMQDLIMYVNPDAAPHRAKR